MFFNRFGVTLQKSIRRRVIVNKHNSCVRKQMRLTNLQYQAKKPTRFIYRIEYTTPRKNGGFNFIHHLVNQS